MTILHISDTHGLHKNFPMDRFKGVDVVVHSGDCSNPRSPWRNFPEVMAFIEWYKHVPVKHKIYVAGNHDSSIENKMVEASDFAEAGITYLENSEVTIDGVKFWGSPYTPTFGDWAFMKARDKIYKVWAQIPEDVNVLITHGPPLGVLDLTYNRDNTLFRCGDRALLKKIMLGLPWLNAVLFGHIHNVDDINNQGTIQFSGRSGVVFSNGSCVEDGRFDKGLTSNGNIIQL